jgi:F0F1-type ATP synthase membrane subunit b/b'
MLIVVYKFAYHRTTKILQQKIDKIAALISEAENKKEAANQEIIFLEKTIVNATEEAKLAIINAEKKAQEILNYSNRNMATVLEKKQKEYQEIIKKIEENMSVELKNQIVELIIKEIFKILENRQDKTNMHSAFIKKSIEMLEQKS